MKHKAILSLLILIFVLIEETKAQVDSCNFPFRKHTIHSEALKQGREFWVNLPLHYSDTLSYPVMYVLDAEWRFNLIRNIALDFSANNKTEKYIIVGIPHINWKYQRGIDLSFSESRIEYDGDAVDSTWYNPSNAGGGFKFYEYLTKELIPMVDSAYSTNGHNSLVGHSMGGYFAGYILSKDHPFETLHLYDPSIWYSNGEVIDVITMGVPKKKKVNVFITYQPVPEFHKNKIDQLIKTLKGIPSIQLDYHLYEKETHNSLFLPSFLKGLMLK